MLTNVAIQPVLWKKNSPNVTNLGVKLIYDNLQDTAQVYWELYITVTPATDVAPAVLQAIDRGNVLITGADYTNWSGDNNYPFTYVLGQLGLFQ